MDGPSQKTETEEVEFGQNEIVAFHRKYLKERFFYAGKARELIQDGYFTAPFAVKFDDGSGFSNAFYTPFNPNNADIVQNFI